MSKIIVLFFIFFLTSCISALRLQDHLKLTKKNLCGKKKRKTISPMGANFTASGKEYYLGTAGEFRFRALGKYVKKKFKK